MGAMAKSAQIPYISWASSFMEAPTPVMRILHRATLVTAGYILISAIITSFRYSSTAL